MAAVTAGLSEEEIDRLLFEAETRLQTSDPRKAVLVGQKQNALSTNAVSAGVDGPQQSARESKKSDGLSVRTPELPRSKNKDAPNDAGAEWFHMPKTSDDPQVKRDLQILKMRNVLALGKQHFKRDGRRDPIPRFSQVGTIVEGPTDFYSGRLTKKERKRTLAEEVLSSHETLAKFKSKYNDIQQRNKSGRKSYYKKLVARRKRRG
ncbi:hypothetical protein VTK73DRAFT_679 [Phialemonium thermophilum]|uniref:Fcf2 pre-rRNA processing C-terminal domain-containing protein n=1 Tax=Phialemonium thermophilum TaxID=223376 RepID=A0ABR3XDD4_9PEZI